MQTQLHPQFAQTPEGRKADQILRSCVHCGFCNATCPTYQLLGNELDGPRGRIYLIKQILEGEAPTQKTQQHLDRCLTCRACETTCPSGVKYGHLLDIGREQIEKQVPRKISQRLFRWLLRKTIPFPKRVSLALSLGRLIRPFLPAVLKHKIPKTKTISVSHIPIHSSRKLLLIDGCVQSSSHPQINLATEELLAILGIQTLIAPPSCCGALSHHLSATTDACAFMKQNIDAWWPYVVDHKIEAIISTASGCGVHIKEYGELLQAEPGYRHKAIRIAELTQDIGEFLAKEPLEKLRVKPQRIAFHSPCTLQHGQKLATVVEQILQSVGFELLPVKDSHLCCGSAGTYSLLQPIISQQLLQKKLTELETSQPEQIATANIGCLMHLQSGTSTPVRHWVELIVEQANLNR